MYIMDSITNSVNDPLNLVEKIVFEVKSQGLFDRFRKECIADVDTKPAYQNLRQRVESSVTNFLKDQKWSAELNKNHIRDKLRKQVAESGFLETGVERIVDQVVNPKITTTFLPQVEDIVCKYLGIDKLPYKVAPTFKFSPSVELKIETDLLPTDLEAVSPDSEKSESNFETKPSPPSSNVDQNESCSDKIEEFESPAFEPLCSTGKIIKEESNDSNMSVISGLTSQDSVNSEKEIMDIQQSNFENVEEKPTNMLLEPNENLNLITRSSPDSQLSQVSSDSRLSILTHSNSSKSGIIESEPPENTNSVEPSPTNALPESSQHTFIDIKNEFEKTIIKDNIVEKLEIAPVCNDESTFDIKDENAKTLNAMNENVKIECAETINNESTSSIRDETSYSKEIYFSSQTVAVVAPLSSLEAISAQPEPLTDIKLEVSELMQQPTLAAIKSNSSTQPFSQEVTTIAPTEPSSDDIKPIVAKENLASATERSIEPSPKFFQEGSSDSVFETIAKPEDSNTIEPKNSKSEYKSRYGDDSRKIDSKSSGSRYSKSYYNDRDKDKYRSRDRSRDRKYSSSKSSRDRCDRDSKYDHGRSRTNTPDKSKASTSSSRSSKKYSSSDRLYDKKKRKSDDHSSSRSKNQEKRRSTDHDSNDGSNDGYSNSRSNSSSNQNGGSSNSNIGSSSTSNTNNYSVSNTNNSSDRKQNDRDYKREVSSNRCKYEPSSSSKNYATKFSSSSSSKRRSYESSSHSSSSKYKKSRNTRDDDLLYFPDKNCHYKPKGEKFLQFASDLRKQCNSFSSAIFLSDAHPDFVNFLQRKHGSVINFVNDDELLLPGNTSKPQNMRNNKRADHHINKKLFRENNRINLNFLQQNMMKFDDIITNEKVLLQLNSDTALEKGHSPNAAVTKTNILTKNVNMKAQQSMTAPNEVATVNLNNNTVIKPMRPKISQKSSQTYSNEDLYKPRNVFGQRSRRRGLNNEDMF